MGRGVNIPWVRVDIAWIGCRNTMDRAVDIPWVGEIYTMHKGVKIPWVVGSIYHGWEDRHTMDRGSIYHG